MKSRLRTDYKQDLRLVPNARTAIGLAVAGLLLLVLPAFAGNYVVSQFTFVFVNWIVALGLMLLIGYAGQVSMGHAAFFAVGAYAGAILEGLGVPFVIAFLAAGIFGAATGVVIGLPALRMKGIYLVMATLAFAFIVEEIIVRWTSVTHGNRGIFVPDPAIFGFSFGSAAGIYYLALVTAVLVLLAIINVLRSRTGRALMAIRDSDVAAETMGINLAFYKTVAFSISAATAGLAGFIYAHKLSYISPEQFGIGLSIEFLMMVIIGGLGSVAGALFGAIFVVVLPQLIVLAKPFLPRVIADFSVLDVAAFAVILILFVLFEPLGLNGYWLRAKTWFVEFPLYKRGTFKRQKIGSADLVRH